MNINNKEDQEILLASYGEKNFKEIRNIINLNTLKKYCVHYCKEQDLSLKIDQLVAAKDEEHARLILYKHCPDSIIIDVYDYEEPAFLTENAEVISFDNKIIISGLEPKSRVDEFMKNYEKTWNVGEEK